LDLVHFRRLFDLFSPTHGSIFRPLEGSLDLLVNLTDHEFKLLNEFLLVAALKTGVFWISHVLILQKVVMSLFTGTDVCFGVGKQIVGTKGEQVKLADLQKALINLMFLHLSRRSDHAWLS
jgi:hypothetical protein